MAAKAFNENPRKSLSHLVGLGVLAREDDAVEVAQFCRTCPGVDKEVLGQYFGKVSGDFNRQVLKAFVDTFDWSGTPLDTAVRDFLVAFRLPGEAQQIDLIMETFAARWYSGNTDKIKTQDTGISVLLLRRILRFLFLALPFTPLRLRCCICICCGRWWRVCPLPWWLSLLFGALHRSFHPGVFNHHAQH